MRIEVLFTPADFDRLPARDLSQTTCVVFDVLRATSSIITALHNGAAGVVPVSTIAEALELRRSQPDVLLAGERDGVRIPASLAHGTEFDLGNSPREFTKERVGGRRIVMTTTNGTRALRACAKAKHVFVGSLLNLSVTARHVLDGSPGELLLVCGGTYEEAAYEDALAAGGLAEIIELALPSSPAPGPSRTEADSTLIARTLFRAARHQLLTALGTSRNGRRLLEIPALRDDVAFCAKTDSVDTVGVLRDGVLIRAPR